MGLTVLYCVCRIVTFMKALSLAVGLMDTAIPMDMKIATTRILALGSEVLIQNEVMVNRPGAIEDMAGMAILSALSTFGLSLITDNEDLQDPLSSR